MSVEFVELNNNVQDEAAVLELLAGDIEPFYLPRLPYHNWDEHIQTGMSAVSQICDAAEKDCKPVNAFMAKIAYMGHDAGFAHDLIDPEIWTQYGSKEGYSAHIMGTLLERYGFNEEFIGGVKTCIMFTKMGEVIPEGISEELENTAIATRMADLFNVYGTYSGFILNSFKLMEEDRVYGREKSLDEFKKVTKFVLNNYMDNVEFLPVGFCRIADGINNIERLMTDTPKQLINVLGEHATRFAKLLKREAA